ncbi:MAG: response regulator [Patescibacteria group bacterium]
MSEDSLKKKILIVEDEELLSEMYQEVFEKEGFNVVTATNGQEAVKVAAEEKPDFILLDILLPGEDGIYFLEQRKLQHPLVSIPVIAFSNFDDPNIKKTAFRLGARDYLIKTNYTPQEVVKKVKRYLS